MDVDPFQKGTVISYNQNQPGDNPYSNENDKSNLNANNDNPFLNDNPYSGSLAESQFPNADDKNNDNPYSSGQQGNNLFEGEKRVSDKMFVNPKMESYNDVEDNKDKPEN